MINQCVCVTEFYCTIPKNKICHSSERHLIFDLVHMREFQIDNSLRKVADNHGNLFWNMWFYVTTYHSNGASSMIHSKLFNALLVFIYCAMNYFPSTHAASSGIIAHSVHPVSSYLASVSIYLRNKRPFLRLPSIGLH